MIIIPLQCLFFITNIVDNPVLYPDIHGKGLQYLRNSWSLAQNNGEMEVSTSEEDFPRSYSDCVFVYSAVRAGSPV